MALLVGLEETRKVRIRPPKMHRLEKILLYVRQNRKCYYCGCEMLIDKIYKNLHNYATVDHVVAKKHKSWNRNVVLACSRCNSTKGSMDAKQFKELLKRKGFCV